MAGPEGRSHRPSGTCCPDILIVSCADKLNNARAVLTDQQAHGRSMFTRFSATQKRTLWYYRAPANIFSRRLPGPLSRDLSATVGPDRAFCSYW